MLTSEIFDRYFAPRLNGVTDITVTPLYGAWQLVATVDAAEKGNSDE